MSRLVLFYLGAPRVERDGSPIKITLAKASALLAYVAVTGQEHSRDTLATLLWPEHDAERAYTSLRSTIWVLNNALGRGWLESDRKSVELNRTAGFWLDVGRFNECLAVCRSHGHPEGESCPACLPSLAEAANLYRADFLSGLVVRDSLAFEEWQFFQSAQLREAQASALARLSRAYGEQGHGALDQAITYARRWVALDPLHEPAHQQLIRLYMWSGQHTEALRQYQACVQILQQELGAPPSANLAALYRKIQERQAGERPTQVEGEIRPSSLLTSSLPPSPVSPMLPAPLTPFLGRAAERVEIAALLRERAECRLVTLVGPAGIGKTRLALQVAEDVGSAFPDGVAFVSLESISSIDFLVPAIADAVQFSFYSGQGLAAQLLGYLREKKMVLALDNFEQLLEGAGLLADILHSAPEVKMLVTSQERLNLAGEWLVKVEGLSFPPGGQELEADAEDYSAVQLFLQTAQRIQPGFDLSPADRPWVSRICQLVDGMPLGIELAASWAPMLSCEEIALEIERSLEFLATSMRNVPGRHRSMRAVFDHAWRLLSAEEQRLFQQVSVFVGGFRQEAAAQVAEATLPVLLSLVNRGLLRRHPSGRYDRHPLLWRYANEKLCALPPEHEAACDRHCAYYAAFLQRHVATLKGSEQKAALGAIEADIENVRLAWQWAVAHRRETEIEQALEGMYLFYEARSWFTEGADIFGEAARQLEGMGEAEASPRAGLLGKLLARQGAFCSRLGQNNAARELLQNSLEMLRQAGPGWEVELAFALSRLAFVLTDLGEAAEARRLYQECLAIYQDSSDRYGLAMALKGLGGVLSRLGEYAEAERVLQESQAIFTALGDRLGLSQALNNLGVVASIKHMHAEAQAYWRECLSIYQEMNDRKGTADALNNLGTEAVALGEYDEARALLQQSLPIYKAIGHRLGVAHALDSLGNAECGLGSYAAAHRCFREALGTYVSLGSVSYAVEVMYGIATQLAREGKPRPAIELLAFVLNHPKCVPEVEENARRLSSEVEVQLPPEVVALAQAAGQAKTLEDVLDELMARRKQQAEPGETRTRPTP